MNNAESIKHKIDMFNRKYKEETKMEPTSVWKINDIDKIWITQDGDEISLMLKNKDDITKIILVGDAIKNHNDQFVTTLKADIDEMKEEYEDLQHKYNLERCANETHHKFFRQYAGKGVEIEFDYYDIGGDDVTYVIVDKEEYKALKNSNKNLRYKTSDKLLEELKTQNFEDEKPSSRRDILKSAEKCVCGQREQDYGSPESNFRLIADLWNDYLKKERSSIVVDATDVAMMMALLKIARIRNGGGSGDSFVDLAGYAACGGEIWAEEQKKKDQK